MNDKFLGSKIKKIREQQGVTRRELADYLEISYSALANYENGNRNIPVDVLAYISQYFNIEMDFFLSEYTDYSKWKKRTDTIYNAVHFYKYDDVIEMMKDIWSKSDAPILYREFIKDNNANVDSREIFISYYEQLNEDGKKEATKRVEELTYIPKYTKKEDK